ncbi:phosphoglycerate kinase [Perkinsela sp. CCAP 1560/4]|nr:phosphoglycerate kinase [Perkinsela sp. CCAP 1560/4]|eukprot:KNH03652.1 phosphoglycerate kinase [Perkinsela sp. CCAP 1560/4]
MEFVPYAFYACKDTDKWEIFHMNIHAKRLLSASTGNSNQAVSLRSVFSPEVLSSLTLTPGSTFVLGKSLKGGIYSIQTQRILASLDSGDEYIRLVAIRKAECTLPSLYSSTFSKEKLLFPKLTVDDVSFAGRRVMMRVDYNVPMSRDHKQVTNDYRIQATLPSIRKILADGPQYLVLISHWGQPKKAQYDEKFSLKPVAAHLQTLLGAATPVVFGEDCMNANEILNHVSPKSIVLLENLRFAAGENSSKASNAQKTEMTEKLASYADIYVNDAFGAAHRSAVSTVEIPKRIGTSVAGRLLAKELHHLSNFMQDPTPPIMAIVGGAKVTDKIKLLKKLAQKVDYLAIGGAMAIPFLKAKGVLTGKSFIEKDDQGREISVEIARDLLQSVENASGGKKLEILLPIDHAVAPVFRNVNPVFTESANIPSNMMALDIGPKTVAHWSDMLMKSKTILWMGPLGVFEYSNFKDGTMGIARAIGSATEGKKAMSVVGGGDTVSAVHLAGVGHKIGHVSTGGGATLALLEGQALPGVIHLTTRTRGKL